MSDDLIRLARECGLPVTTSSYDALRKFAEAVLRIQHQSALRDAALYFAHCPNCGTAEGCVEGCTFAI